jgi:hypothetical protein
MSRIHKAKTGAPDLALALGSGLAKVLALVLPSMTRKNTGLHPLH